LTNTNQSASSGSSSSSSTDSINTLSNLYPSVSSRYLTRSSTQVANYPQPVRFTNVDQILVKAASETKVKPAIAQMTDSTRIATTPTAIRRRQLHRRRGFRTFGSRGRRPFRSRRGCGCSSGTRPFVRPPR
jgi:hypothetical protein